VIGSGKRTIGMSMKSPTHSIENKIGKSGCHMCIVAVDMCMHIKEPIRDSKLLRPEWIREIVYGHSNRIYEAFKMKPI